MAKPFIQTSFNSGEWAPNLWARTDLEKYKTGAALLRNFFVDYRGGATTRSGTRYILKGYRDTSTIRLIPFQSAISVGYVMEFGDQYIRFYRNGAPVLESALTITGATKANPCVVSVANSYAVGDWVYITGVAGMTQLNGKYFIISARTAGTITLSDLFGNAVDSSAYGAWTSGGTVQRIYTISTPYAAADLALIKYVQNISAMILCHPSYAPQVLTFVTETNWTINAITFGATITKPTGVTAVTTLTAGSNYFYSYVVTAVDVNGQESSPSAVATVSSNVDFRTAASPGTSTISWTNVSGAQSYNVYRAVIPALTGLAAGSLYGYIGNTTGTSFKDPNIAADFSQTPPIAQQPFINGASVAGATITTAGTYTTAPTVTFADPPSGHVATGIPILGVVSLVKDANGSNYAVGDTINFANGVVLTVLTIFGPGQVDTVAITNPGSATTLPTGSQAQIGTSGIGTLFRCTFTWQVTSIQINDSGAGYITAPAITFSTGVAAATAILGTVTANYPGVPAFFQQRLALGGTAAQPQTLYLSQPGFYYNYDITNPVQDDDAITAPIVTGQLSNIKALIPQPGGLIVITDGISYLVNGGSLGATVTPATISANPQSFVGANDMPPIVVNFDILSVPAKGSSVRDNTYNFYANVFTGTDISVISSHLFFGYQLTEWAWAEEPYKTVWAVRNDGTMLCLTFIKEQEFIAWTHHDTEDGDASFMSVATIVESATVGYQNYVYVVVERVINGTTVQYIEYMPERPVSTSAQDYWTVDCAISYSGAATTSFQGGEFLAGKTCTGLADGSVITPFVMPASGNFTLATAASNVKVGLAFQCDLQTLYIDLGNQPATVQSRMKQIPQATLRVTATLGLKIGSDANNLVTMKDLVIGNVGSMTNELVTSLVTGDARTLLDPKWQEPGQLYIRQDQPYPATILGYIPQVNIGEVK